MRMTPAHLARLFAEYRANKRVLCDSISYVEHDPAHHPNPEGIPLPPELAAYLRDTEMTCLMQLTDQGTAFVIKLPGAEIDSLRGAVPILKRHELYRLPSAPVIRTLLYLFDQPNQPLALETFTNIEDERQRAELATLAQQDSFTLLFYNEELAHQLSKVVQQPNGAELTEILSVAEEIYRSIPPEAYDFDLAKARVMQKHGL